METETVPWWRRRVFPGCTCPIAYRGLGRLYGVDMGKGWVRVGDDPACPEHGRVAS